MGASSTAILALETAVTSYKLGSQGLDLLAAAYPFTAATDSAVLAAAVSAIDATLLDGYTVGDFTTGSSSTTDIAALEHLYEDALILTKQRRGSTRILEIAAYNAFNTEYGSVAP